MSRPPLRLGPRRRLARWLRIAAAKLDDQRRPPAVDPRLLAPPAGGIRPGSYPLRGGAVLTVAPPPASEDDAALARLLRRRPR